jgi:hypothetical protein
MVCPCPAGDRGTTGAVVRAPGTYSPVQMWMELLGSKRLPCPGNDALVTGGFRGTHRAVSRQADAADPAPASSARMPRQEVESRWRTRRGCPRSRAPTLRRRAPTFASGSLEKRHRGRARPRSWERGEPRDGFVALRVNQPHVANGRGAAHRSHQHRQVIPAPRPCHGHAFMLADPSGN